MPEEGDQKCVGYDLYAYVIIYDPVTGAPSWSGWLLIESNSPTCGYTPPCEEGAQKCVGYDLYECQGGSWVLVESNSLTCGYTPPEPLSGQITKSEIIVAGERRPMGSQVPAGDTLVVSLTIQNLSSIAIEMGVYWELLDPTDPVPHGSVRQEYNSPAPEVGPGSSHVFDGPALTVDVEGTWFIYAELYGRVSGGEWVLLNSIYEPLCVVAGAPPEPPPGVLQLRVGNTCRVMVNYDYSGPPISAKLRVPIGRVGVFGFDEVVYKVVSITVPNTPEKTTYQTPVDIYISSAMRVQPGYDLYAKIVDIPGADIYSPFYEDVIEIIA